MQYSMCCERVSECKRLSPYAGDLQLVLMLTYLCVTSHPRSVQVHVWVGTRDAELSATFQPTTSSYPGSAAVICCGLRYTNAATQMCPVVSECARYTCMHQW